MIARARRPLPPAVAVALAGGATLLGVVSRGEAIVLGALLVALSRRRGLALVAVAGALTASSWRWGTTSLEALAGAQAVLGPAGGVGPTAAAAGSWLAGLAILLALGARPDPVRAVPAGVVVAAVLAGPAPGGDLPVRVIVAVGAAAAAYGAGRLRARRPRLDRAVGALGAVAGLAAVAAVASDAPDWPPATALADVWEGLVLAAGVALLVLPAHRLVPRAPWSRPGAAPNVDRPGPPPAHLRHPR